MSDDCRTVLQNPGALNVFDETHRMFMDETHPDYVQISECYLQSSLSGDAPPISSIGIAST